MMWDIIFEYHPGDFNMSFFLWSGDYDFGKKIVVISSNAALLLADTGHVTKIIVNWSKKVDMLKIKLE